MKIQSINIHYICLLIFLSFCSNNGQKLNKFTITENELFDKIMENDLNQVNKIKIDKSQWSFSTAKKQDSILLNENKIIARNEFDFNKSLNNHYTILYGFDKNMWLLNNQNAVSIQNNNLNKNFSLLVNDFFSSPFNRQYMIFSDSINNRIYKSKNGFQDFTIIQLPFKPEIFYFTKDENVLFSSTVINNIIDFWISIDFGSNWIKLQSGLTDLPKWNKDSIYYIDTNTKTLTRFDLSNFKKHSTLIESCKQKIENVTNVVDFELRNDILFVKTKKNDSFEIIKSYVKRNSKKVPKRINVNLNFKNETLNIKDFDVLSVSDDEIVILVTHQLENNQIQNDVFKTNKKDSIEFEMSLKNVSMKKIGLNDQLPEFQNLNEKGFAFIANVIVNSNEKRTFLKRSTSDWSRIEFDNPLYQNYSLDLFKNFYYAHQSSQSSLEKPKLPEFMIATGVSSKNPLESIICVYTENQWRKVLDGNYLYSIADNGQIILAIEKNKKLNEFIYSYDFGHTWSTYKFTRKLVIVDDLVKEPYESNSFALFARNAFTKSNLVFSFEFLSQSNHQDTQIKFINCSQTCIYKKSFEETCINDNQDINENCLLTGATGLEKASLFETKIDQQSLMFKFQKCVYFLNQYIVPSFIAFSILFLILVLLVVFKTKANKKSHSDFILSKIAALIKLLNYKKNTKHVIYTNDKETLINHTLLNNNDKSINMLNIA